MTHADYFPDPYLHLEMNRIYNPLTDKTIRSGDDKYVCLANWINTGRRPVSVDEEMLRQYLEGGWVLNNKTSLHDRYLLKYVSLELHTLCNQECYFCPVSVMPRHTYYMPVELYHNILDQLVFFRDNLIGIFLHNYNEPTLSRNFVEEIKAGITRDLPVAINTNGTGLTPRKIDAIRGMGGVGFISLNLSTLNAEDYQKTRGHRHLEKVLRHVDYLAENPAADRIDIAVLGKNDASHEEAFLEIANKYGHVFNVNKFVVNDRSGNIDLGLRTNRLSKLAGCNLMGSRPLQHLHIDPYGKCILCCQDYAAEHVVGDLNEESIEQVLTGEAYMNYRKWIYGLEDAPEEFLCRKCSHAVVPLKNGKY